MKYVLFASFAFLCSVYSYEIVDKQCYCVNEYPDECNYLSGVRDEHTLVTQISEDKAAVYWLNKISRNPSLKCKLNSKRFIEIYSGDHYSVGLGYQDGMGGIKGHYDFGPVDVHGFVGGNPLSGNYGGGIGVTIPFGK